MQNNPNTTSFSAVGTPTYPEDPGNAINEKKSTDKKINLSIQNLSFREKNPNFARAISAVLVLAGGIVLFQLAGPTIAYTVGLPLITSGGIAVAGVAGKIMPNLTKGIAGYFGVKKEVDNLFKASGVEQSLKLHQVKLKILESLKKENKELSSDKIDEAIQKFCKNEQDIKEMRERCGIKLDINGKVVAIDPNKPMNINNEITNTKNEITTVKSQTKEIKKTLQSDIGNAIKIFNNKGGDLNTTIKSTIGQNNSKYVSLFQTLLQTTLGQELTKKIIATLEGAVMNLEHKGGAIGIAGSIAEGVLDIIESSNIGISTQNTIDEKTQLPPQLESRVANQEVTTNKTVENKLKINIEDKKELDKIMNTQLMNTKLHPEINSSSEIKKESAVEKLKHERDINSNKGNTKVASI